MAVTFGQKKAGRQAQGQGLSQPALGAAEPWQQVPTPLVFENLTKLGATS